MKFNRKRGRPRAIHSKIDKGTPELQRKKSALVKGDKNTTLSESLLGILYACNLITRSQYDAGQTFQKIGYHYTFCLGSVLRPTKSILAQKKGIEISEDQDLRLTKAWRSALNALKNSGLRRYTVVMRTVFYDDELSNISVDNILELRQGLESLVNYFKGDGKAHQCRHPDQGLNHLKATIFQ